jgi:hypothetical protein
VRPDGVEAVRALEALLGVEAVEDLQPLDRPAHHRDRDRAVEGDDGSRCHVLEDVVQREDPRPIGRVGARRLVVQRRDRGLDPVRADRRSRRALEHRARLGDQRGIPPRAVLIGEGYRETVRVRPRSAPRLGEEHQTEQPRHLGFVGDQLVEQPRQPDRLRRQVRALERVTGARRVSLVEDQVQDVEDGRDRKSVV